MHAISHRRPVALTLLLSMLTVAAAGCDSQVDKRRLPSTRSQDSMTSFLTLPSLTSLGMLPGNPAPAPGL